MKRFDWWRTFLDFGHIVAEFWRDFLKEVALPVLTVAAAIYLIVSLLHWILGQLL